MITARIHHSLAVRVVRSIADLVILPPALLLVLDGVHVLQHRGAVAAVTITNHTDH